ncbi:MAG: queuosine precursor transporter [Bacteroidota bacterium]|nr:queuosine precursor transporter [Bacteroidota bacterium]
MNEFPAPPRPTQRWLPTIASLFVTSLVISNIIAVKLFAAGPFVLPAAIIIFPISYIFGDVLTEVYGYARARQIIWIGFGCNLFAVAAMWISIQLSPAAFWTLGYSSAASAQQAYEAVLGFTPRLLASSFAAYLAGEFLNSFVMAKMKLATNGKYLWTRTIGSTFAGQLADSGIFITLAFIGIIPSSFLLRLIVTQWLVKSAYEIVATPLTYAAVTFLKRSERQDYYDRGTDFNPLRWSGGK